METHKTEIEVQSKDAVVRYKGPAIYSLIIACIAGIVIVSVFVADFNTKLVVILPLSVTLYSLVNLLAAVLGFRLKKDE